MLSVFLLSKELSFLSRLRYYLLFLSAFSLPWILYGPVRFANIFLIAFYALTLLDCYQNWKQAVRNHLFLWGVTYMVLHLMYFWLLPVEDAKPNHISASITFVLFPFFLALSSISKTIIEKGLKAFIIGVALSTLFVFSEGISFLSGGFDHLQFEHLLVMHRPYFGMYLLSGAVLSLYFASKSQSNKEKWFGLSLYQALWIILIYSKMTWLSALIIGVILSFYMARQETRFVSKKVLIFGAGVVLLTLLATVSFIDSQGFAYGLFFKSFEERLNIWGCSLGAFSDGLTYIVGIGYGNENNLIDACFTERGLPLKHYNAHNQWLSDWMSMGVLGLLTSVSLFFIQLRIHLRSGSIFFALVILTILLGAMTESIFYRMNGVLIQAVIASMLFQHSVTHSADHV